jgi:hypothetical protein
MSAAVSLTVRMVSYGPCCTCGVPIYGPEDKYNNCLATGKSFYCINGHALVFGAENDRLKEKISQLERERDAARAREQMAKNNEKSARHASKIAKGKLKARSERVKTGVCPCCNRTFVNLQRHMVTKHPKWNDDAMGSKE